MFQKILFSLFIMFVLSACQMVLPHRHEHHDKDHKPDEDHQHDGDPKHRDDDRAEDEALSMMAVTQAVVVLNPTEGNEAAGEIMLTLTDEGMHVTGEVTGLTPGEHGFHFHQMGDCRASDGTSAGGHYNPEGNEHGHPEGEVNHVGDMLNIVADDDGVAVVDTVNVKATFSGPNSVLGRGMIIHAEPDDYESQPSGASGSRVACGVVGVKGESAERRQ